MSREWKPGDVAIVEAGCWANRKIALRLTEGWSHVNGVNVDGDGVVNPVRPLVVIDPEDREQVGELLATYGRQFTDWTPELDSNVTRLQAALRSLIEPPKPEVYEHLQRWLDQDGELRTALCGKVWSPNTDVTVVGRCPDCAAAIEGAWIS